MPTIETRIQSSSSVVSTSLICNATVLSRVFTRVCVCVCVFAHARVCVRACLLWRSHAQGPVSDMYAKQIKTGGHSLRGEMLGVHTELGMFLKSAAEKLGAGLETQDDYMIRGPGATISQGFVDVPPSGKIGMSSVEYSPIFVANDISELSEIVARTPQGRLGDLVLLQTGLPRAIVRERKEGCRFREIRDLHHHSPCSSFHGTKTQANAHQQVPSLYPYYIINNY